MLKHLVCAALLAASALVTTSTAQSNVVNGLDIHYGWITDFDNFGDNGSITGLACETTICNPGSVDIPWFAPMNENHSMFGFIVCRDSGARFEQISDRSFVKHPFTALSSSQCTPCTGSGGGTSLGIGCSDTYWAGLNASRFYLAPPEEVNPWLGTWEAVGSYFDRGVINPTNPSTCCDGVRSLTSSQVNTMNATENMLQVQDADFAAGGTFYYGGYIVSKGEAEALRDNNSKHRRFTVNQSGGTYNPSPTGAEQNGNILNRWASKDRLDSATNGADDGRIYIAVKTTGPSQGLYHYEYAVMNRDNNRGVGSISFPKCADARILNMDVKDVDDDLSNDWTATVNGVDVTFASNNGNGLYWNTLYNFSFDSDAAPADVLAILTPQDSGPGAPAYSIPTNGPTELHNVYLGDGCSNVTAPVLFTNKVATIGNDQFRFLCDGGEPGSTQFLYFSNSSGVSNVLGCDLYLAGNLNLRDVQMVQANGRAIYQAPVPNDPSIEGFVISVQAVGFRSAGGPLFGSFELSSGLKVRIGSNVTGCL